MGRTPGAVATVTRERLLRAAADVFAQRGYDGTRVADIAEAAGLSQGAMYAYFGSKADLLVGALRAHGRRLLSDLLAAEPARPVSDLLQAAGRALRRRPEPDGYLVIEALVAARRDTEVAHAVRDDVRERTGHLAALVRAAQVSGELDTDIAPEAVAHLCLALGLGTALVTPDLHDVDDADWAALVGRLVAALAPADRGTTTDSRSDPRTAETMGTRP